MTREFIKAHCIKCNYCIFTDGEPWGCGEIDEGGCCSEGLMKDAVDGTVSFRLMPDSKNFVSLDTNYTDLCFNEGDKVKLLIFKVG